MLEYLQKKYNYRSRLLSFQTCSHPSPIYICYSVRFDRFACPRVLLLFLVTFYYPDRFSVFLFLPILIYLLRINLNFFFTKSYQVTAVYRNNLSLSHSGTGMHDYGAGGHASKDCIGRSFWNKLKDELRGEELKSQKDRGLFI